MATETATAEECAQKLLAVIHLPWEEMAAGVRNAPHTKKNFIDCVSNFLDADKKVHAEAVVEVLLAKPTLRPSPRRRL